ncbi:YciI family protein [Thiomonas intermedia]|uniref:YciI family protein n=1 Tax=Thiomonas intermedia TaxID=926 RepID=UPI0009A48F89|nr:YciI family protein [Thiomonas intermedia]
MRYLFFIPSSPACEAETGSVTEPWLDRAATMAVFHQELAQAGVLLDAGTLRPSCDGWRVHFGAHGGRHIVSGPFPDASTLAARYILIQVASRAEALEWSRRLPNLAADGQPAVAEVRLLRAFGDPGLPSRPGTA